MQVLMGDLFRLGRGRDGHGVLSRCRRFIGRNCHPLQVGTGLLFSAIGIGVVSAGYMYADGLNFVAQTIASAPNGIYDLTSGGNFTESVDYVRESYKGSMEAAVQAGWKQAPLSYCVGHYIGGRVRKFFSGTLYRRG